MDYFQSSEAWGRIEGWVRNECPLEIFTFSMILTKKV